MTLTTTLLMIALPWGVSRLTAYMRNRKTPTLPLPQRSLIDLTVTLALIATLAIYLYLWITTFNLFSELGVPKNVPSWQLRALLKQYLSNAGLQPSSSHWDIDALHKPQFPPSAPSSYDSAFSSASDDSITTAAATSFNEYDYLSLLYDKLRTTGNRDIYTLYSDDALLNCKHCSTPFDYFLYSLPNLLAPYALTLTVVCFATSTLRKSHWRFIAIASIIILLIIESLVRFNVISLSMIIPLFGNLGGSFEINTNPDFVYTTFLNIRTALFSSLLILILLRDITLRPTQVQQLRNLKDTIESAQNVHFANTLLRTSVLADLDLRKQYMDHYQACEVLRNTVYADSDLQQAHTQVLTKLNTEIELEKTVHRQVNDAISLAAQIMRNQACFATNTTTTTVESTPPTEIVATTTTTVRSITTQPSSSTTLEQKQLLNTTTQDDHLPSTSSQKQIRQRKAH